MSNVNQGYIARKNIIIDFLKTKSWYKQNLCYINSVNDTVQFIMNDFLESININTNENIGVDVVLKHSYQILDLVQNIFYEFEEDEHCKNISLHFHNLFFELNWILDYDYDDYDNTKICFKSNDLKIYLNNLDIKHNIKYCKYFHETASKDIDPINSDSQNTSNSNIITYSDLLLEDEDDVVLKPYNKTML